MSRSKDSQRQKVYDAERTWERANHAGVYEALTLDQAQEWLDMLVHYFDTDGVTIRWNRRIQRYGAWYKSWYKLIEAPGPTVPLKTVLHEFSHHLEDWRQFKLEQDDPTARRTYSDPGHGAMFTQAMLDVTEAVYGTIASKDLRQAYLAKGVLIGRQEAIDRAQKRIAAQQAREKRIGQTGKVYIVASGLADLGLTGHTAWADGQYWAHHWQNAKAYRTLKAAKQAAARTFMRATIYETEGRYQRSYGLYRETETPTWQVWASAGKPQAVLEFRPVKPDDSTTGWQKVS